MKISAVTAAQRTKRSGLLDCIRAVAIISVFLFHVATRYPQATSALEAIFRKYMFLGVDLFFPLSGFLITRFLITTTLPHFVSTFFLRRIFRILPLYLLAILIYVLAAIVLGIDKDILHRIWVNVFFLTGWFIFTDGVQAIPYTITWSLSVEEFAYILVGLFSWFSRKNMPKFIVFLCVAPLVLRFGLVLMDYENLYYFPPTRLDSIALGGLLAILIHRGWQHLPLILGGAFGAVLLVMQLNDVAHKTLLFTTIALGTCYCIALFETTLKGYDSLPTRILANIGFYSYYNYLFQFFTIDFIFLLSRKALHIEPSFWTVFVVAFSLTHLQAILSHKFFEAPLMRFGRSLERRQVAPLSEQT